MADRIGLRDPQEAAVEVELGDRVYKVATMTRTRQGQLDAAEALVEAAETADEVAVALIGVIGVVLEPVNGQRKGADVILKEMWEGDKLAISQLAQLSEDIQDAATGRPT